VLWLAAHHHDKKVLEILSKELAPAGTGMGEFSLLASSCSIKVRNISHDSLSINRFASFYSVSFDQLVT